MGSIDVSALTAGLDELGPRGLADRLSEIEQTSRALAAAKAAVIAQADRSGAYREDGHVSVRGWTKATIRLSNAEVTHLVRTATLVTAFPQCGDGLAAGELGVAHAHELARTYANPRCADQFAAVIDDLIGFARTLPDETFARVVRHCERLADGDGAHRDADHTHAATRCSCSSRSSVMERGAPRRCRTPAS